MLDRSTLHFVMLFVGICVAFVGVGGWFALHDTDYGYSYDRASDTFPQHADGTTEYYDQLEANQRAAVDRAMAGETLRYETEEDVPPAVVRKNETYHAFDKWAYFDWLNPVTLGPTLVGLLGVGITVEAARRDIRHRP